MSVRVISLSTLRLIFPFFSFSLFRHCESRKYTYFFPTYLLIPPKPGSGLHRALTDKAPRDPDAPVSDFWEHDSNGSREEGEDDLVRKRSWRVRQEQVQSLRNIVEQFEGTHNFHNFTAGRDSSDPSCKRHMKKIQVSNVFFNTYKICFFLLI